MAYATAEHFRHDYGVIGGPPSLQNVLVNLGMRKRGLCFQWAEDLLVRLDALKLTTLELHWAEAYAGTWRERNCVVVTAKDQPFQQGIILDCWRHSGHLCWSALETDHYPWVEDSKYAGIARRKFAVQRKSGLAQEQPVAANEKAQRSQHRRVKVLLRRRSDSVRPPQPLSPAVQLTRILQLP